MNKLFLLFLLIQGCATSPTTKVSPENIVWIESTVSKSDMKLQETTQVDWYINVNKKWNITAIDINERPIRFESFDIIKKNEKKRLTFKTTSESFKAQLMTYTLKPTAVGSLTIRNISVILQVIPLEGGETCEGSIDCFKGKKTTTLTIFGGQQQLQVSNQ